MIVACFRYHAKHINRFSQLQILEIAQKFDKRKQLHLIAKIFMNDAKLTVNYKLFLRNSGNENE